MTNYSENAFLEMYTLHRAHHHEAVKIYGEPTPSVWMKILVSLSLASWA